MYRLWKLSKRLLLSENDPKGRNKDAHVDSLPRHVAFVERSEYYQFIKELVKRPVIAGMRSARKFITA